MAVELSFKNAGSARKDVEKLYGFLQSYRQKNDTAEIKLQCLCPHQRGKSPSLKKTGKTDRDGNMIWACKRCGKPVNLIRIEQNELQAAVDLIDSAIDVIKMTRNLDIEKEAKMVDSISKLQFKLVRIPKHYEIATRPNKGKRTTKPQSSNAIWKSARRSSF